jgi:hypothetical protein
VDGFWAISVHVLSTVDRWCCWALGPWWITEMLDLGPWWITEVLDLGPWWITEVLDLVHRGLKKWASTDVNGELKEFVGFYL